MHPYHGVSLVTLIDEISIEEDKSGGANHPLWLMRGFMNTMLDCDLIDLPLMG